MPILDLMFATSIIRAWKTIPKNIQKDTIRALWRTAQKEYTVTLLWPGQLFCPAVQASVKDDN